jgi:hypothetical protein
MDLFNKEKKLFFSVTLNESFELSCFFLTTFIIMTKPKNTTSSLEGEYEQTLLWRQLNHNEGNV